MATLTAIRDAIKDTITANIAGLHGYDTVPDIVVVPAFVVAPASGDFNVAMGRGTDTWEFDLTVLTSRAIPRVGQDALDAYVTGAGASSIRQVIFNNRALGLSGTDAHVARMSDYGPVTVGDKVYLGATLRLIVHTTGTA